MPLHRERELGGSLDAERLDQAIGSAGLDDEAAAEVADALGMQRVHRDAVTAARELRQQACALDQDVVRVGRTAPRTGLGLVLAVVDVAGHILHVLPQRTAMGDIHFLETAAQAEHGDAGRDGARDQRKRGGIALRVVQRAGFARARHHSAVARHWTGCR